MMSAGMRSGVNWIRENCRCRAAPRLLTSSVFAEPGHAFEESMAAAQQAGEQAVHDVALPHDGLGDLGTDARHVGAELRHLIGYVHSRTIPSDRKYCLICSR